MSPYPKCIKERRLQHVAGINRGFDVKESKKKRKVRKKRKKKERVYIELQSFKLLPEVCDCLSPCLLLLPTE